MLVTAWPRGLGAARSGEITVTSEITRPEEGSLLADCFDAVRARPTRSMAEGLDTDDQHNKTKHTRAAE